MVVSNLWLLFSVRYYTSTVTDPAASSPSLSKTMPPELAGILSSLTNTRLAIEPPGPICAVSAPTLPSSRMRSKASVKQGSPAVCLLAVRREYGLAVKRDFRCCLHSILQFISSLPQQRGHRMRPLSAPPCPLPASQGAVLSPERPA